MSGTRAGGKKAAAKNMDKDPDFYKRIGSEGGKNGRGTYYRGGFATDIECSCKIVRGSHYKAQCAGVIGGRKSRRTKETLIRENR